MPDVAQLFWPKIFSEFVIFHSRMWPTAFCQFSSKKKFTKVGYKSFSSRLHFWNLFLGTSLRHLDTKMYNDNKVFGRYKMGVWKMFYYCWGQVVEVQAKFKAELEPFNWVFNTISSSTMEYGAIMTSCNVDISRHPSVMIGRLLNPDRVIAIMLGVKDDAMKLEHRTCEHRFLIKRDYHYTK